MRQQGTRDFLAPFQGALLRWSAFPGVRKKRVPLANFLAPLRGATEWPLLTPKGCKEISQGLSERSERNPWLTT